MKLRLTALLTGAIVLAGFGDAPPPWPVAGPTPDEPVHVAPPRYRPVSEGTRSYRPVTPLPWGDVNRRVAPPSAEPKGQPPHPH